jgi:hypothetical protein
VVEELRTGVFAGVRFVAKASPIANDRGVARAWNIFSIGRERGNEDQRGSL